MDYLQGDASRAREKLGWTPQVGFKELVAMMVDSDMQLAQREKALSEHGFDTHEAGKAELV